jgi:H/ACA ribonucleoprotein complex non-core subunit NAF1
MFCEEDDGLIEQTVRLVLDDVCAKVEEATQEQKNDSVQKCKDKHARKLVDYESTEVEASEDDTMPNVDVNSLHHSINDTSYIRKHLAGNLNDVSHSTACTDEVIQRHASGPAGVAIESSDSDDESESDQSSLSEEDKSYSRNESRDSSSSDWNEASADEESEAEDETLIQQLRTMSEKDMQVDIEDKDGSDFDSDIGASHEHPPMVQGELQLDDLPAVCPVASVLSVDDELNKIGSVHSIVESLVVVQSRPMLPALDTDSVLWRSNRQPLGAIFETFGPVQSPFYSVRFQSPEQVHKTGISVGESIFYALNNAQFTKYVFTHHLMQQKGSDASWTDDIEPPLGALDFSDDEKEKEAQNRKTFPSPDTDRHRERKPRQNIPLHQRRHGRGTSNGRPRRQRRQASNISHCHSQLAASTSHYPQQVPSSSALHPLFPVSGVSQPVVPQPVMPTVQTMLPQLPGFPKQEVPAESGLSSVFYRPPPPGHVETYQQCYVGTAMSHGVPEYSKQA